MNHPFNMLYSKLKLNLTDAGLLWFVALFLGVIEMISFWKKHLILANYLSKWHIILILFTSQSSCFLYLAIIKCFLKGKWYAYCVIYVFCDYLKDQKKMWNVIYDINVIFFMELNKSKLFKQTSLFIGNLFLFLNALAHLFPICIYFPIVKTGPRTLGRLNVLEYYRYKSSSVYTTYFRYCVISTCIKLWGLCIVCVYSDCEIKSAYWCCLSSASWFLQSTVGIF